MTTRNLTDSFIFMRNNAIQNRQYDSENTSDKVALMSKRDRGDAESQVGTGDGIPQEYTALVNGIQYDFTKIQQKMKALITLCDRHLNRASLDENIAEDQEIEEKTKELTQMFTGVHRRFTQLAAAGRRLRVAGGCKAAMAGNIQSNLARSLQDLSVAFRRAQSQYLAKLKNRDERLKGFCEIPGEIGGWDVSYDSDGLMETGHTPGLVVTTVQLTDDNTQSVLEREKEVNEIVRSIQELNGIFRDISQLVADQGSVIDRIDYNIEQTSVRVKEGLTQLQKAHKYQKKNRKMLIIIVLAVVATVLSLILVTTKFR